MMSFVDMLAVSYEAQGKPARELIASVMYLIIGGKDLMGAFMVEYSEMYHRFKEQFPIPESEQDSEVLPEGI
jgi:hypothetical protein